MVLNARYIYTIIQTKHTRFFHPSIQYYMCLLTIIHCTSVYMRFNVNFKWKLFLPAYHHRRAIISPAYRTFIAQLSILSDNIRVLCISSDADGRRGFGGLELLIIFWVKTFNVVIFFSFFSRARRKSYMEPTTTKHTRR